MRHSVRQETCESPTIEAAWDQEAGELAAGRPTLTLSPAMRVHAIGHAILVLVVTPVALISAILMVQIYGFHMADAVFLVSFHVLGAAGIVVALHRYFSHRSFKTGARVRDALAILGMAAAQGPLVYWVANHRRHHRFSDKPGDPHSPMLGSGHRARRLWHSHMGWVLDHEHPNPHVFARDLIADRRIMRLNRLYPLWVVLGLIAPTAVGLLVDFRFEGALRGLVWGGLVRLALVDNTTFAVNSLSHTLGNRAFRTSDNSRNIWWLCLPTLGDAWHNNHHAHPSSSRTGLRWWQLDPGYWIIAMLQTLSLASDVIVVREASTRPALHRGSGGLR